MLNDSGWNVEESTVQHIVDETCCFDDGISIKKLNDQQLIRILINIDMKLFGTNVIENGNFIKTDEKLVLQIEKIRDVTRPKISQYGSNNDGGHRLLKLSLTDGHSTINALEFGKITNLTIKVPPGTKIQIFPRRLKVERGFWLLNDDNCKILGGNVVELIEKWKANFETKNRPRTTVNGAPEWIPFGEKFKKHHENIDNHFSSLSIINKSISSNNVDNTDLKNENFEQTRRMAIQAASGSNVTFGKVPIQINNSSESNLHVNMTEDLLQPTSRNDHHFRQYRTLRGASGGAQRRGRGHVRRRGLL